MYDYPPSGDPRYQQPQPPSPPQPQPPYAQPQPQPPAPQPYYQPQPQPPMPQPYYQPAPPSPQPHYQQPPMPQPYYQPAPPSPQPHYQQPPMPQPYYQPQPQPTPQPQPYYQPYYPPLPPPPLSPPPEEVYKKTLRSKVMKISLSLFLFYVVNIFAIVVVAVCSMLFTNAFENLITTGPIEALQSPEASVEAVEETVMESFPVGLASIAGIIAGSLALLIARGKRMFTKDLTKVNARVRVPELFKMLGLILGVNGLVSVISIIFLLLAQILGIPPNESATSTMDSYMNPMGLLYVVLLGPIFEEIIFRGAILRTLQPFGENFAILLSSLLFGLYHLFLSQGIFAFFVGLVLAYCTLRYSIKWAMLLHITNNGLAMLLTFAMPPVIAELGIYALYLVFGIVAILLSIKTFRGQLRTGKPTSVNFAIGMPLDLNAGQVPAYAPAAAYGQVGGYGQAWVSPQPPLPKPKPYAIAFSSAWLIVGLTIAFVLSAIMMFVM